MDMPAVERFQPAPEFQPAVEFRPEVFFSGETRGWGMLQDRFGRLRRRFIVETTGHRRGEQLTLNEVFRFDDGEISYRTWDVRHLGGGRYEGRAGDVIGRAEGRAVGSVLSWRYRMRLKIGGWFWSVAFRDSMYQQDDDIMINRAELSIFGLRIADLTVAFRRQANAGTGPSQASTAA